MNKDELIRRLTEAQKTTDICCDCLCGDPEIEAAYCMAEKAWDELQILIMDIEEENEDDE